MPARDLSRSLAGPDHVGTTHELFKRHKILPHPRETGDSEFNPCAPIPSPRELTIETGVSSVPSSDTSSPRTLKHASRKIGAPGLPPTPPTHSRQSSGNQQSITSAPKNNTNDKRTSEAPSASGTPPNQKSPPTPDVTPPRNMPPLAFRPPPSDRYPSSASRTDSFKTARENPYSSDEEEGSTIRPGLPSTRPSENEVPQIRNKNKKRKEIGLGLGLETDEGTSTPRPNTSSQQEFVVFDGEWGSTGEEVSEVEREWDDNLMRNVTVRKRPVKRYILTDKPTNEVLEDDIISPTIATKVVRGLPLPERIAKHRLERGAEKFGERMAWPSAAPEPLTPDVRRFSAMSGRSVTSTVIEAMVVDGPPQRQKTLRHSKKQFRLRDFSSDQSTRSSAPNSVISNETQHKLVHKRSPIPDRRHRSLASNATVSTTSSSGKSRREVIGNGGIPVVVIPDRRSSTKSSRAPSLRSTSSRNTKRSTSLNSAPLSQSSKFNEPAYFNTLPPRKRTLSESAASAHSERTIDFPPTIPTRRSSLSAPTSRNTSRAGSLTTESLKAHNMIQQKKQEVLKPELVRSLPSTESHGEHGQHNRLNDDHNGDPFFGNRRSTQATPFSQTSYETAGTAAEVSEAMAVSIFPHQNKSVLVVQQQNGSAQPFPPTLDAIDTSQPKISVNGSASAGPVTPTQPQHPMDEIDSPLRNPRVPPVPPAIKFIPPTPAALTPGQEQDRQLGHGQERPVTSDIKNSRGMSLMRRAFSSRHPNSEPAVPFGEGLLKRTFSLSGRRKESNQTSNGTANSATVYPSVVDRPADGSKLHPFWRPAHFWDDLEDHDDFEHDDFGGRYPIIDNRPAPPKRSMSQKLKRTFAILPIKDDADNDDDYSRLEGRTVRKTPSENMRIVKRRSQSSLVRGEANDRRRYEGSDSPAEFGYGFKDGNGGRIHTIPGLGVRIEYVGWGGIKRKLSERKRQQRSDKLRASISSPKGVRSGIDDVLRRKSTI